MENEYYASTYARGSGKRFKPWRSLEKRVGKISRGRNKSEKRTEIRKKKVTVGELAFSSGVVKETFEDLRMPSIMLFESLKFVRTGKKHALAKIGPFLS